MSPCAQLSEAPARGGCLGPVGTLCGAFWASATQASLCFPLQPDQAPQAPGLPDPVLSGLASYWKTSFLGCADGGGLQGTHWPPGAWRETASLVLLSAQMFLGSVRSPAPPPVPAPAPGSLPSLSPAFCCWTTGEAIGRVPACGEGQSGNLGEMPRMTAPAPPELSSV